MVHTFYQRTLLPTQLIPHMLGLVMASILAGCAYQLPPVQAPGYSFSKACPHVVPPKHLAYDKVPLFQSKQRLRCHQIPLRSSVLKRVVLEGKGRYSKILRLSAMDVLAARSVRSSVPAIQAWQAERRYVDPVFQYQLSRIDPKRFPPAAMADSLGAGKYSEVDSTNIAGYMARLGNPQQFSVLRNAILKGEEPDQTMAYENLWYFWPHQGKVLASGDTIDLYPLFKQALWDTLHDRIFFTIMTQYYYAPQDPILQRQLVDFLSQASNSRWSYEVREVLVYRYHRKEQGFPKDRHRYWSRRRRMEVM